MGVFMNSFGRIFRVHIFGESHGEGVGVSIDGVPAGLPLTLEDFLSDIERRKGGTQKGTTPRQESDLPIFKTGIFNNQTTGAPLTILFENKNVRSADYEKQRAVPRPGHADFVASKKFGGFEDYRGSGHFSGRLTVCRVLEFEGNNAPERLGEVEGPAEFTFDSAHEVSCGVAGDNYAPKVSGEIYLFGDRPRGPI